MPLVRVADGDDGDLRFILQLEGDAGIERLALRRADQVQPAAARREPARAVGEGGRVLLILPAPDADLAEVVHARPHEVADERGVRLGELPKGIGVRAKGLAAEDDARGVLFDVLLIAPNAVVIARRVYDGVAAARLCVAGGRVAMNFMNPRPSCPRGR